MQIDDIYLMFVSWGSGGKQRPILVIDHDQQTITFYAITSKYKYKSTAVKKTRYPIRKWQASGLDKPSYIRVDHLYQSLLEGATVHKIGHLTLADQRGLRQFLEQLRNE